MLLQGMSGQKAIIPLSWPGFPLDLSMLTEPQPWQALWRNVRNTAGGRLSDLEGTGEG